MSGAPPTIRPAQLEDMAAIGDILVRSWRHTFTGLVPADFLAAMTPQAQQSRHERTFAREGVHYRVATGENDQVIGFASAGPGRDPEFSPRSELYAIYLDPGHQRRGIGSRLFHSVVSALPADAGLYLTVLAVNPNRGFHTRLGGVETPGPDIALGSESHRQLACLWDELPVHRSPPPHLT